MTSTYACIAAGGTGGHVMPGLAVAHELVARGHDADSIVFVGSERGIETRLVPEAGFALEVLPGRGIERKVSIKALMAIVGIIRGVLRGIVLVRRLRPKVIVVCGGYASVPCIVGAVLWRVPMVVLARDARAGAADRLAARFAKASAVPFADTDLPRAVVTGNPVRAEVLAVDRDRDRGSARAALQLPDDRVVIGVYTGSLGSRRVNDAVHGLAERWSTRTDIAIHHVIGTRDWDELQIDLRDPSPGTAEGADAGGLVYRTVRYEDHIERLLAASDVVVSRAGGATVAELAVTGVPSVLVPLPIATRDHQTANAEALVRAGAAVRVPDAELDTDRLELELEPLVGDPDRRDRMGAAARTQAHPDAAARVAELVEEHARR